MDWFKGKFTGKQDIYWEIYGFRLRFSLKPIHCNIHQDPRNLQGRNMENDEEPVDLGVVAHLTNPQKSSQI